MIVPLHVACCEISVACSESKAIPEPRIAEQQQCSPAFFVCIATNKHHRKFNKFCKIVIKSNKCNMKKGLLFLFLICSVQMMATLSLVVKPLSGNECVKALNAVGKIVYSGDSLYLYDATQMLVYADLLIHVQHLRFSDENDQTQTDLENVQNESGMQLLVFPNPIEDVLYVRNASANMLRIYTASGQLMQTAKVENGETNLNISTYPSGSYFLLCGKEVFQVLKQ